MRELEEIQERLTEEKARLQNQQAPKGRAANILRVVTSFFQDFESQILAATIAERKEILRQRKQA